jgi:hypothetical protein
MFTLRPSYRGLLHKPCALPFRLRATASKQSRSDDVRIKEMPVRMPQPRMHNAKEESSSGLFC